MLTLLINEINQQDKPLYLVLDDYHVIEAEEVHQMLLFLLEHQPVQLHLVISSRVDPPLPLARFRARGAIAELRARDLRFQFHESTTFFNETMKLNLSLEDIKALEVRNEGWITGLQLAALSLKDETNIKDFKYDG